MNMNILWITNILLPEAQSLLQGESVLKGTGGWMVGAAKNLLEYSQISLSIASPSEKVSELRILKGERITYYLFPLGRGNYRYNTSFELFFHKIQGLSKPDVVHIHGTEFSHGLAYVNACGSNKVVASIQGMTSIISKYKTLGLSQWNILSNITLSDVLLGKSLYHKRRELRICGESEQALIKKLHHVIGRTLWDRANTWGLNQNIQYHFCNETLRPEFYLRERWSFKTCEKHTIFFSQPTNSIKGFHQLLKAMPLVVNLYPDTMIYLAGVNGLKPSSFRHRLLETGYVKYLRKEVAKLGLEKHLHFLGSLNAEQMKTQYLKANVFVCASSIENSSNSIGEAQIIGTPVISSYVGGVADIIEDGRTGFLYRYEETNTLAYLICKLFSGKVDYDSLSNSEIEVASNRHDEKTNCKTLLQIYNEITQND